ncbi:MAG: hypothetical protein JST53_13875 [Actinobacteria bacterium]|nr:hypothetical protein [Actinomycetota bacterium]
MPLGLWKSRWEMHREDMTRHREESDKRSADHEERTERYREECEKRSAELLSKYDRELAETRRVNRQMLTQLEKTYASLDSTLGLMGERIEANTEEVRAQTRAIMLLLDHFKGTHGGPPV